MFVLHLLKSMLSVQDGVHPHKNKRTSSTTQKWNQATHHSCIKCTDQGSNKSWLRNHVAAAPTATTSRLHCHDLVLGRRGGTEEHSDKNLRILHSIQCGRPSVQFGNACVHIVVRESLRTRCLVFHASVPYHNTSETFRIHILGKGQDGAGHCRPRCSKNHIVFGHTGINKATGM